MILPVLLSDDVLLVAKSDSLDVSSRGFSYARQLFVSPLLFLMKFLPLRSSAVVFLKL